ncbi:DUF6587 family protein [Massilia horti]|uniref:Uncharacterized protein n=1 Tax=Massilia horti TaxID=2562153 RepID=A0A4Y9SMI1_9BURK|nr:DUF6587 family protein [Massilia horti]TFW27651.1 hypothetical protein E4O92_23375 [Massilia horti]
MVQYLVVGLIVVLALLYVAAKYLPASWRARIVYKLSRRGTRQSRLAQWVADADSCGSGCDSCKACEDEEPAQEPTGHRVIKLHERR